MAKGKIDYDTVVAATGGDALAAGAVLDYFNDFMDGLCTGFYTDADGFWDYGIDLSMKSFMQAKLLLPSCSRVPAPKEEHAFN